MRFFRANIKAAVIGLQVDALSPREGGRTRTRLAALVTVSAVIAAMRAEGGRSRYEGIFLFSSVRVFLAVMSLKLNLTIPGFVRIGSNGTDCPLTSKQARTGLWSLR